MITRFHIGRQRRGATEFCRWLRSCMRWILACLVSGCALAATADSNTVARVIGCPRDARWVMAEKVLQEHAPREWETSTNGLACRLGSFRKSFGVGEPVVLYIYFKNSSNHPFRFVDGVKISGDGLFPLAIQDSGRDLKFQGRKPLLVAITETTLKPGEILRLRCPVSPDKWGIARAGKYTVSLEFPFLKFPIKDDVPGWEGTLHLNKVELSVR